MANKEIAGDANADRFFKPKGNIYIGKKKPGEKSNCASNEGGETQFGLRKVQIAVLQTCSTDDKEKNLIFNSELIQKAIADRDIEMIFLPEAFDYIAGSKEETVELAESLNGFIVMSYKVLAKKYNVWISLGGVHERLEDKKEDGSSWMSIAHVLLNPKGEIVSVYRKMHLFDMNIPQKKMHFKESSFVKPGKEIVVSESTPIGNIGLGVCYDLRFPEFASALRSAGAQVLTYPSAFTKFTGAAHWETLLKARAIENQCFVIAAAQQGNHVKGRSSYGHSMIIDPWGTILDEAEDGGSGVIYAEIDLSHVTKVREEMPVWSHKLPQFQGFNSPDLAPFSSHFSIPAGSEDLVEVPFGHVKAKSEIIFLESRYSRAFVNRRCVVPGHVLVVSKRIAKRLKDLSPVELSDLFLLVQKVQMIIESMHGVSSSTMAVQDGLDAGQTIQHIHVHILPRKAADFAENDDIYKELASHDKGSDIKWRDPAEMKKECEQIRLHIRNHFPHLLKH